MLDALARGVSWGKAVLSADHRLPAAFLAGGVVRPSFLKEPLGGRYIAAPTRNGKPPKAFKHLKKITLGLGRQMDWKGSILGEDMGVQRN